MIRSMSRKGSPQDNAAMESYFHTLKAELVHKRLFDSDVQAASEIIHYMMFYNRERVHSSLGYRGKSSVAPSEVELEPGQVKSIWRQPDLLRDR
ncbi:integrase core domain-containing protein [Marinobacter sp. RI1]|uniref:integrase core domain-containing protein n=1 Tax=Marinobacter sp. RI1 TaxID=3158171 RepID=UPI0034E89A8C